MEITGTHYFTRRGLLQNSKDTRIHTAGPAILASVSRRRNFFESSEDDTLPHVAGPPSRTARTHTTHTQASRSWPRYLTIKGTYLHNALPHTVHRTCPVMLHTYSITPRTLLTSYIMSTTHVTHFHSVHGRALLRYSHTAARHTHTHCLCMSPHHVTRLT